MIRADVEILNKHYPDSDKWKRKVGNNTLHDCKKYGIDALESIGTKDPLEIGEKVKQWNVEYLSSGPVLAFVFEGVHAVERIRSIVGPTVPVLAPAGTIRGDYSLESAIVENKNGRAIYNLLHASGTVEEAEEEIELWFTKDEILTYKREIEGIYD